MNAFVLGHVPPFANHVIVASTKPVEAFDDQQVAAFQFSSQPFPCGAVEIFAALLVDIDEFAFHASLLQCYQLPIFILVFG